MVFTIDDPLGILGLLFTESTVYKVLFQSETLLTLLSKLTLHLQLIFFLQDNAFAFGNQIDSFDLFMT